MKYLFFMVSFSYVSYKVNNVNYFNIQCHKNLLLLILKLFSVTLAWIKKTLEKNTFKHKQQGKKSEKVSVEEIPSSSANKLQFRKLSIINKFSFSWIFHVSTCRYFNATTSIHKSKNIQPKKKESWSSNHLKA